MTKEKTPFHQVYDTSELFDAVYEKTGADDYEIEDVIHVLWEERDGRDSAIVRVGLPDGRVELFVTDPSGEIDLDADLCDLLEARAGDYIDLADKTMDFLKRFAARNRQAAAG